ncbi:helix-turn-helix domain-containing protein [Streptococcus troglodytae]
MSIKEDIGLRIRTEREKKGMSREVLCLDGDELTVRQLLRIENGESLPSLEKLEYIAQRLETSLSNLLAEDNIDIPDEYYELKNRLIKFPTYGDEKRIEQKLQMIEDIYDRYFPILPEEELLTLDIIENIMNFAKHEKGPKIEEIFEDVFDQAQKKKKFSSNDLLVIDYYFLQIYGKTFYDKKLFEKIVRKLLKQEISKDDCYNIELLNALITSTNIYMFHNDYKNILSIIEKALRLTEKAQQQTYKPGILAIKGKYYLNYEKDRKKATAYYDEAIAFASILGDSVLELGLKEEKKKDGL